MSGPGDNKTYDANGVMASVYDPALRALRISGSGASGAPVNASYVTMVAEAGLSNESVLGPSVIMEGVLGSRPAAATAGRLYHATDNGILYRDSGSTWIAITTAGDMSEAVIIDPALSTRNVIQSSTDATELTLKAFAGQTAPISVVKDENNNTLLTVDREGAFTQTPPGTTGNLVYQLVTQELASSGNDIYQVFSSDISRALFNLDASGGIEAFQANANAAFAIAESGAFTRTEDQFGAKFPQTQIRQKLVVQAQSGQTFPILALQNTAAFDVVRCLVNGTLISNAHAAPADGDLNNSDFAFYNDDTVGGARPHWKAKDSAGTVFSEPIGNARTNDYTQSLLLMGA